MILEFKDLCSSSFPADSCHIVLVTDLGHVYNGIVDEDGCVVDLILDEDKYERLLNLGTMIKGQFKVAKHFEKSVFACINEIKKQQIERA